jgi:hypothetical protein
VLTAGGFPRRNRLKNRMFNNVIAGVVKQSSEVMFVWIAPPRSLLRFAPRNDAGCIEV